MADPAVAPSDGVLAAGGAAMVHALVFHHPVPQDPPAEFTELVDPLPARDGTVADWRLGVGKLLGRRDEHVHDVWSAFSAWRRTYVAERVIGDRAGVRAFLGWADQVGDASLLHALNLDNTRIEPKVVPRMAWQATELAAACRRRAEQGLGISVPQRPGLVRGFVVGAEPLLVLADRGATVSATADGLTLVDPTLGPAAPLLVHGWSVDARGVTAVTDEGPRELGTARSGRLLALVAPGVAHASVAPVPLTSVFSGIFVGLREAAELAAADHAPLWIRTGAGGP